MIDNVFRAFAIIVLFLSTIALAYQVSAQNYYGGSSSQFVNYQPRPSFNVPYSQSDINTYWPILGDKEICEARQDIILQVSPVGCKPTVVRSDLLADQNVPVFCQIDAVKINPLIDIERIRTISFSKEYPKDVANVGFHPARVALRSQDKLLGSPLINNIGYVVVVLKKNEIEKELPDSVSVNLTATIDYIADDAVGIGKAEFLLKEVNDAEWELEKNKQSFWQGRYFLRLEKADSNFAIVSVYKGDRKIATTRVDKGEESRAIYVPGVYWITGFHVLYTGFEGAEEKARIEVVHSQGNDVFDVYEGTRFLDDSCSVTNIEIEGEDIGNVTLNCKGKRIDLSLQNPFKAVNTTETTEEEKKEKDIADIYFEKAIENYEKVLNDLPAENVSKQGDVTSGEIALSEAISLAQDFGKDDVEKRLVEKYLENYPQGERVADLSLRMKDLENKNYGDSINAVELDDETKILKLLVV